MLFLYVLAIIVTVTVTLRIKRTKKSAAHLTLFILS